ncbi:MAG: hypothetical protein ABJ358_15475 [Rhizobiaceae bacterium]
MLVNKLLVGLFCAVLANSAYAQSTCETECRTPGSPLCITVPEIDSNAQIKWAFANLHPYIVREVEEGEIPAETLLAFFNMTTDDDPCGRHATKFSQGKIKNTGVSSCRVTVGIPHVVFGFDLNLGFDIPINLIGDVSGSSDAIHMDFSEQDDLNRAVFWIENAALNSDWGGFVNHVFYGGKDIVIETTNGCVRYEIQ